MRAFVGRRSALWVGGLLVAFSVISWSLNDHATGQDSLTQASMTSSRDAEIERALKKLVDFNFDEDPLSDIFEQLRDEHRINIVFSKSAADYGINEDDLVTSKLVGVPFYLALELMLADSDATYTIRDGVVLIIPQDEASSAPFARTKMFDCEALLDKMPTPPEPGQAGGFGGMGGGLGGGAFSVKNSLQAAEQKKQKDKKPREAKSPKPRELTPDEIHNRKCNHLMDTIADTIDEDVRYAFVGDVMLVTGSETSLRRAENLLIDLHAGMQLTMPKMKVGATAKPRRNRQSPAKATARNPHRGADRPDPFGDDEDEVRTKGAKNDPFGNPPHTNPFSDSSQDDPFGEDDSDPFGGF